MQFLKFLADRSGVSASTQGEQADVVGPEVVGDFVFALRERGYSSATIARRIAAVKSFFAFAQESWQEAGRVSWPTRKETLQTTAIVFAFVVVMALFLFAVDSALAYVVKLLTGRAEG